MYPCVFSHAGIPLLVSYRGTPLTRKRKPLSQIGGTKIMGRDEFSAQNSHLHNREPSRGRPCTSSVRGCPASYIYVCIHLIYVYIYLIYVCIYLNNQMHAYIYVDTHVYIRRVLRAKHPPAQPGAVHRPCSLSHRMY